MTPKTREELKKSGLTDDEIDTLWRDIKKQWEDGSAEIVHGQLKRNQREFDPYGPIPDDPSHFGGEIGGKMPFQGLGGLKPKESGLRPKSKPWCPRCYDPSHNPPMHLYIPPDQEYVHVCPSCGATVVIQAPEMMW